MSRAASIRSPTSRPIETELMLADLDSLEQRVDALEKKAKGERQGRQGGAGDARSRQPRARAAARRQAGAPGRAQARGGEGVSHARPADLHAGALRLQRRRSLGRRPAMHSRARSRRARKQRAPAASSSRPRSRRRSRCCRARSAPSISPQSASRRPGLDRLIRAGYALLASRHLFHRRAEGGARLDHHARHQGAAGGGRDPYRLRARLHPRRDHRL